MPDLSHRPTRYATAAVVAAVLAGTAGTTLHVRLGPDSRVAALQKQNAALKKSPTATKSHKPGGATARPTPRPSGTPAPTPAPSPSSPGLTGASSVGTRTVQTINRTILTAPTRTGGAGGTGGTGGSRGAGTPGRTGTTAPRGTVTAASCASFPNQEAAQAAFDADRVHFAALDGDRDGTACEQLRHADQPPVASPPRTVPEPAAPVPAAPAKPPGPVKPTAPDKAALLGSGMHFGMSTPTDETFSTLEASLQRQADLHAYFAGFDTDFDAARVTAAWNDGQIPFLTWESRPLAGDGSEDPVTGVDYSLSRIAGGAFDDYLTAYAKQVTATGLPVAIRFDQEMNGNWYRWAEFENPTAKAGDYIAAWRHVHDVFQAQGANAYVMWVWSPNRVDNLGRFPKIDNYYPGDDYVDEVGMTGYLRTEDKTPATFSGTYDKTLGELRRVAPGKPILLSEVGATENGGRKASWLADFFLGLVRNPDVAGFAWFDYAVTSKGSTDDWRIDSTPASFTAFKTGLNAISYGLDVGKRFTLRPRASTGLPVPAPAPTPTPTPTPTPNRTATATPSPSASPRAGVLSPGSAR